MKKVLSLVLSCTMLSLVYIPIASAEETYYKNSLGAGGGFVTGYGLSYRKWFNPTMGLQVTFAPFVDNTTITNSIGFTFLKKFIDTKTTGLFMYAGYHNWYNQREGTITEYNDKDSIPVTYTATNISVNNNFGVGPGLEVKIDEHIVIDLMFGYAVYINHNNNRVGKNDSMSLQFTGECGIYYNF
ncbi:MAG: hypothetical protein WC955_09130 [Elusimicrobiota bacterium]